MRWALRWLQAFKAERERRWLDQQWWLNDREDTR